MAPANDIAEFLTTRRANVTPEQAGLPSYGPRRVKGLRREEVASLAGVSVEYYKRLAPKRRRSSQQRVRPVVQRVVDAMTTPAIVRNSRVDYLSADALGQVLEPRLRRR